ncbi:hypothetical protein [Deinococcus sp. QL22]|uniref:hypothetical protein n=1 Tax=Deinococcus sp. QL22 TaxID=2939437 RepID=UPI0020179A84|nr:hypothetical protein [Deinococcus sp. QL22]UQN06494.1 hypothetical protein M1R55_00825 [Deinococcus sp. QL22]
MASAQTVQTEEGQYQLFGCYVQNKQVLCDVTFTLTSANQMEKYFNETTVFSTSGTQTKPADFIYAGKPINSGNTIFGVGGNVFKSIPVKLTVVTGLPVGTSSIRALILDRGNVRFDNIAVRGAAPAPVVTPAPVSTSAYNAVMTNCKPGAGGTMTCTATLTPRR